MVLGYDESRWAKVLNYHEQSAEDAVELFRLLRRAVIIDKEALPESSGTNTSEHTENGTMTMDDWLGVYEEHIPAHVAQMERVYNHWQKEKSDQLNVMPTKAILQFPRGFLWGCATAAHQVEGQLNNDWTQWEQTSGHIYDNDRVGNGCEWWAGRYVEDFDRAAEMNNNAHRMSVEWSRIEPKPGQWDKSALAQYREMLKALIARGMTPMVTLHHFTDPLWIAEHQGWLWDETPVLFERFVRKVVGVLGDLRTMWCTINEPAVYATQGFGWDLASREKNRGSLIHAWHQPFERSCSGYHAIKQLQPAAQVGHAAHLLDLSRRDQRLPTMWRCHW